MSKLSLIGNNKTLWLKYIVNNDPTSSTKFSPNSEIKTNKLVLKFRLSFKIIVCLLYSYIKNYKS